MKREELKNLGLTDEQIKFVMDENGKDINAQKTIVEQKDQQIAALTTERDGLKTQVADRDKDIVDLKKQAGNSDELNQKLTELQTKYDTDTQALQGKLDTQARTHAAERYFDKVEFSSAFAKKAAIAEFNNAGLEFKDGAFIGADDFLKKMKTENPDAFKVAEPPKDPDPKPQFTNPNPKSDPKAENPFSFGFTAVRNHNNQ